MKSQRGEDFKIHCESSLHLLSESREVLGVRCFFQKCSLVFLIALTPQLTMGDNCHSRLTSVSAAKNGGFTITELLVVMGITAVLVGLTIPALSKSRSAARDVKCLSNLRQNIAATHAYEMDYKVLPVHTINNTPPNPTASVDLGLALGVNDGIRKAWECPEDKGFTGSNGESLYHSYIYLGLSAMFHQGPPPRFIPENAQRRYERELSRELYYRIPVYMDARPFHNSRKASPDYTDGQRNAVWWDGRVGRIPTMP